MQNDPLIGTQIGAYFIQGKLGEGGMAQVYKAYHAPLRREVAIKVISPQIADSAGFRNRFEREAQLAASLEHRSIVAIYDFGEVGNRAYLVMQYVGGGTLREMLRSQGQIEPHKAIRYAIQMARALHHAHQHGIVHRDVKPQNMLISSSDPDELLLSDFGIAKILAQSSSQETLLSTNARAMSSDPSLTSIDQMVGTAEYMAPEQINRQAIDARTDVYALGIVLFQMLSGQVPFTSTTVQGLLFQHVYTPPKSIRELNPSVPVVLEQIIARALAKAPEHRYQSAEAMALALEAIHAPTTHEFSASMTDNFTTLVPPSQGLAYPAAGRTVPTPLPTEQVYYGPTQGASPGTGIGARAIPSSKKVRPWYRLSNIMYGIVCLLAIALLLNKFALPWACSANLFCLGTVQPPATNSDFHGDNFHNDNKYGWTMGNLDGGNLKAEINNNQYTLTIGGQPGDVSKTYFPHPATNFLPTNFTLTVQMEQTTGDPAVFYGVAFRLQGNDASPSSYAFDINGQGEYHLEKYVAGSSIGPLTSGNVNFVQGSNSINTLQVTVQGDKFSFQINSQVVHIVPNLTYRDTDHPLMGGRVGILVSGPQATFVVKSV